MPSTDTPAFIAALVLAAGAAHAAPAAQPADPFDFWLGDWTVTWKNANGTSGKGRNHVQRILDGPVIEEQFEEDASDPAPLLRGRSLSVRQQATGVWRQAWADNQGGWFAFTASVDGERRIFATELVADKGQRMVFHDTTRDGFTWDWEATADGGKSWKLDWQLLYRR
jgi:hypothetical protein